MIALAILIACFRASAATEIADTALDRYDPAPPDNALLWVPDAAVDGSLKLSTGARLSYARSPLVFEAPGATERIVTHQLLAHAMLAAELVRRFELALDLPFVLSQDGSSQDRFESPSGAALGDLRLGAKAQLVAARGMLPAGALALELWAPTGDGDFASAPSVRYGASLIVGGDLDAWSWRARFGVRHRRDDTDSDGLFGSEAHAGVGVGVPWRDSMFGLELVGATGIESSSAWFSETRTHLEALLSARQRFGPVSALLGAGPGLTIGAGTPAYRVVAGVELAFELAPRGAPFAPRPIARSDRDGDGVPDDEDACPDVVGAFQGCPPDGGQIPDAVKVAPPGGAHVLGPAIVISEQIQFATGKDELLAESFAVLGEVAKLLEQHPEIARVSVDGHTDDVGDDAKNLTLSRRRALAVVRWLVARGIDERRLEARGFGARQPLVNDKTDEARSKNRRVEFQIRRRTELGKRGWKDGPVDE